MRVGQARKRDANEEAICKALEACGAQVLRLGVKDAPDLLVRCKGWGSIPARLVLLEVKTARGNLKAGQKAFHLRWPEVVVVRSVAQALAAIGVELTA